MSKISTSLLIVASILLVIVCFFNIPSNGMISLIGCAGVVLLVLGCLALGFKDHFSNIEMVNLTSKFVNIVKDILLVGSVLCASLIIDVQYYKWSIALASFASGRTRLTLYTIRLYFCRSLDDVNVFLGKT